MNLLNKLTIKNLKLNKKRTIVTIIGIILSVALITAVSSMFFSARSSMIEYEKKEDGNYHFSFENVPFQNINEFKENRKIESVYLTQELGYDYLEGCQNQYKPYINVKAFSKDAMENLAVNLIEGRLPENENEILIPTHTKTNGRVTLNIGETLELNLGTRVSDGEELNQNNPYDPDVKEEIVNTTKHTYTIVGIMERPSYEIEGRSAPGYTFITYMNKNTIMENNVDVYVRYTKEGLKNYLRVTANILGVDEDIYEKLNDVNVYKEIETEEYEKLRSQLGEEKYDLKTNSYLLTLEAGILEDSTLKALATAVAVVAVIIIVTSVFCIKNSFDISITEKTKQYGMLASIGATKRQIKKNVYYEALILGLIGTPIGILCGQLAAYILIIVSNYLLRDSLNLELKFSFSWLAIIFAILLAIVTIYLSARKSAKRASKITPIVAIRNSEDIKINSKKIKSPKIINKIFGIGGEIAYKNLKRSKKKYRTTVISIVMCTSIFIAVSSFINLAFDVVKAEYENKDYNVQLVIYNIGDDKNIDDNLEEISNLDTIKNYSVISNFYIYFNTNKYTKEYLEIYPGVEKEDDVSDMVYVYSVNTEEFSRYVRKLGLNYEDVKSKGILINNVFAYKQNDNKQIEISKYSFNVGDSINGTIEAEYTGNEDVMQEGEIEIAKITTEVPMGLSEFSGVARMIISEELGEKLIEKNNIKYMYIDSSDGAKTQEDITQILKNIEYSIVNTEENAQMIKSFYTLLAIFLYGFMIVIALIGITNIFNTITTNMSLRSREFAMLQSCRYDKKRI